MSREADPDRPTPVDDVPVWEDEYLDRVSDRLMFNYDLEKDRTVAGERFALYGRLAVESQKHFLHPALTYARHETYEHLFARRTPRPTVADLESLVDVGHDLADEWIDADEDHYGTEFTFVLVAEALPTETRSFVEGFRDRTLLKHGYHGRYEVNVGVVAPDREESIASENADVVDAFRLWGDVDERKKGLLTRLFG